MANNFVNYSNMTALMAAIGNKFRTAVARAANVSYDNTNSGLEATNVQDAIDEICNNPPGPDVPDGKTVTPINDVVIWQQCAGLTSTYTTLDEVLADSGILSALMASENAVDYMVRSKAWTVKANVPVMTSNTTPEGVASASHEQSSASRYAWKVFDNDASTDWDIGNISTESIEGEYIQYTFTYPVCVTRFVADIPFTSDGVAGTYIIQGSNDGFVNDINDLYSGNIISTISQHNIHDISFANAEYYLAYRFTIGTAVTTKYTGGYKRFSMWSLQFYGVSPIPENQTAMSYIGLNNYCANTLLADSTWREAICNSEYFESVLNVKVPTMTSATTPSGEVTDSTHYGTSYGWKAFDGDDSTVWETTNSSSNHSDWVNYAFDNPVKIYIFEFITGSSGTNRDFSFKLQGSNDNSAWNDLYIFTNSNVTRNVWHKQIIDQPQNYKYYRFYYDTMPCYSSTGSHVYYATTNLQYYGRQDV